MTETVLYLTTLHCPESDKHIATFVQEGWWVQPMQEAPWPDVEYCPHCGAAYPDDLAEVIIEDAEARRVPNPEIPPEERDD